MQLLLGVLAILGIVVAGVALTAFLIARIKRDTKHGTSGTLSSAMLHVHSLLQPDKERMAESIRAEREDEGDPSGDPPCHPEPPELWSSGGRSRDPVRRR